jgi:hypothetical protein
MRTIRRPDKNLRTSALKRTGLLLSLAVSLLTLPGCATKFDLPPEVIGVWESRINNSTAYYYNISIENYLIRSDGTYERRHEKQEGLRGAHHGIGNTRVIHVFRGRVGRDKPGELWFVQTHACFYQTYLDNHPGPCENRVNSPVNKYFMKLGQIEHYFVLRSVGESAPVKEFWKLKN